VDGTDGLNIAETLRETAATRGDEPGVLVPDGYDRDGTPRHRSLTFGELNHLADRLAAGLVVGGLKPGQRLVLMVRPGIEFIALTYAIFRAGGVVVLIDPGMGPRHVFHCLDEVEPDGFVAIPMVHAVRTLQGRRFRSASLNVTVGRRWFWGGATYADLLATDPTVVTLPTTAPRDPAAVIFTSGSTGPAKGVLYEHGMFAAQVRQIRDRYGIEPGGIDLPGFPLFGLFNAAMGVTTVIPDMNPSRPARIDPRKVHAAVHARDISQAFGSPAIWTRVAHWCEETDTTLPTLRRVLSAGAPIPPALLKSLLPRLAADAEIHTPYGATEALPVASISAREVLAETATATAQGAGTCVGLPFSGVEVRIIARTSTPIDDWSQVRALPVGEIGEIVVKGAVVTREYFRRPEATALAKIPDGEGFWHRMGDVGYFDERGRLWFCGRKSHVVETERGPLYTDCVEPIFQTHRTVSRAALVGVGPAGRQTPVVWIEPRQPVATRDRRRLVDDLLELASRYPTTRGIREFRFRTTMPVDVRHNAKIRREELAIEASRLGIS
jgi:acyl-CoA synthetase (AMP-forming)/AMP-acid ligase II